MITRYTVENREHVSEKSYEVVVAESEAAVGDAEHHEVIDALNAAESATEWGRAGLQVPLSIMIWEDSGGHARVSYDLPSSVMSFLDSPELANAANALDAKLGAFVEELTGASA
jgi:hypothetical protein